MLKQRTLMVFLGMFVLFTLASMASVDALLYKYECQNSYLHQTYNGSVNNNEVNITRDPIRCPYGCTNLTWPPQCIEAPRTDTFTMPYISTPIFLLFEILALVMLGLGVFYRTEADQMVIILPILSTIMFIALSVSALNIDGISNPMVMWMNFGFFMLSLIASVAGYIKKPLEDMGPEDM